MVFVKGLHSYTFKDVIVIVMAVINTLELATKQIEDAFVSSKNVKLACDQPPSQFSSTNFSKIDVLNESFVMSHRVGRAMHPRAILLLV